MDAKALCCLTLLASMLWMGCTRPTGSQLRFERLSAQHTGLTHVNRVAEDSIFNALDFTNLYTGSGIGIGDLNNDGLPEILAGGCMESSTLYLNQGNLQFEDITLSAGLQTDRWITGVNFVDINADGWLDIYMCVSGPTAHPRENLLFINQHDLTFVEMGQQYGLNDSAQCTQASFFDYDRDGDLDVLMVVNPTDYHIFNVNSIRPKKINGEAKSTDKLYRNEGNGRFTDVSRQAGILVEGYSLGLHVSDFDGDGWPDVYVTNDFLSNDILYINQQDGTFRNQAKEAFGHSSFASMGIDVADLNNDGKSEIFVADMYPESREHEMMMMSGGDYNRFKYILMTGYEPQYSRNTLQYNHGNGRFSEIGQLAGVHRTDWSWSPLLVDLDLDGLRDIFISNGFLRDMGDLDYINYQNNQVFGSVEAVRKRQLAAIKTLPSINLPNYCYHNQGDFTFTNQALAWGLGDSSSSQGAAYGDLDGDGDWDLVVNNTNQPLALYENHTQALAPQPYLALRLIGDSLNPQAVGSRVTVYTGKHIQTAELQPARGYASSVEPKLLFGLGNQQRVDSMVITWPDGSLQSVVDPNLGKLLTLSYSQTPATHHAETASDAQSMFEPIHPFTYIHREDIFSDFLQQPLIPHDLARLGPALAIGDVDANGLDDLFVGGSAKQPAQVMLQQPTGAFTIQYLPLGMAEDIDATWLDVDGDQDLDLYIVRGGSVYSADHQIYQDQLYLNDGQGHFTYDSTALPPMPTSGAFVRPYDWDQDGDEDLFVAGRAVPGRYPQAPASHFLENQAGTFHEVTAQLLTNGTDLRGMYTDGQWVNLLGDEAKELVVVGEWEKIAIYSFQNGILQLTSVQGLTDTRGWWYSLASGDFDQDGDMDLLAGNLGANSNYRASVDKPLRLYAADFDANGTVDPILTQFTAGKEYPLCTRDQLVSHIVSKRKTFNSYQSYATATINQVLTPAELAQATTFEITQLASLYIENLDSGRFLCKALPWPLQVAPIQDFWVGQLDQDAYLDVLVVGNSFSGDVKIGRYDAFRGAYLGGKAGGGFDLHEGPECGFEASRDARHIGQFTLANGDTAFLIANNDDSLDIFRFNRLREQLDY